MLRKISDYFKIEPKSQKTEDQTNLVVPEVQECRILLKDIKHQFEEKELKLFDEILLNRQNSSGKEKNDCKFCGKKIHSNMKQHVKKVHSSELDIFYCQFCSLKFLRKSNFDNHIKAKHPEGSIERFECDFDGKVFKTKGILSKHIRTHLPLVKCKICEKILKQGSIDFHMNYFHGTNKNFNCKICSKSFKTRNYLTAHVKSHNKKFECEICKKMFASYGQLNYHKKAYHENTKSFDCEDCDRIFKQKRSLKSHQKTHDKNRPKPYKCDKCDYATDTKQNFSYHQKSHERQDKKFAAMKNSIKCEKCSMVCRNQTALRKHMKSVHPKVLFQCDLCAIFIKKKSNLIRHMKVHI